MKILIVSPHFPPRYIGGVEMYTKRLADMLLARGERPEVVAAERVDITQSSMKVERESEFGYPVHRLSGPIVRERERLGIGFDSPECERAMNRIFDDSAPDLLHLHSGYLLGGPALAAARHRRIPVVVTLHDYWFICPRITLTHPSGAPCSGPESAAKCAWCLATEKRRYAMPDTMLQGRLGRGVIATLTQSTVAPLAARLPSVRQLSTRLSVLLDLLQSANVILSPSHFLRDQMIRAGMPGSRIQVSRYGIEIVPVQRSRRSAESTLCVGYLGQVAPHKGVHVLIEAVRRMATDRLEARIYGDLTREPGYVEHLRDLAAGDTRITFPGPYVRAQVYEILGGLDVIVVPSVWYENAPFVIQEAQASGVPVVASRLGGMRELVSDQENGLLFEPGNANDLARQLQRFIDEPRLVERLEPNPGVVRSVDSEFDELHGHYARLLTNLSQSPAASPDSSPHP
jgi:glycosyltransferase involved in cell wall biosynthesis